MSNFFMGNILKLVNRADQGDDTMSISTVEKARPHFKFHYGYYDDLHPDYLEEFNREDGFEDWNDFVNHFKQQDRFKDILSYNDINFQEIENVLIDYGINIQNMWGIVK